jgi:hypothetical protein
LGIRDSKSRGTAHIALPNPQSRTPGAKRITRVPYSNRSGLARLGAGLVEQFGFQPDFEEAIGFTLVDQGRADQVSRRTSSQGSTRSSPG